MTSESTSGSHRLAWCWWAGFLVFLALTVACPTKSVMADEPVPRVYTYAGDGRADSLSADTLREIFFMRLTSWPDGTPIRVFVLPDKHPLHVRFAKEVLGVYAFNSRRLGPVDFLGNRFSPSCGRDCRRNARAGSGDAWRYWIC